MKHIFIIGEKERHEIEVDQRGLRGNTAIVRVDGEFRARKSLTKRGTFYETEIGDKEIHKVELKYVGFFPKTRCFVDGHLHSREAIVPSRWEKPIHITTFLILCGIIALFAGSIGAYLGIGSLGEQLQGARLPPYVIIENRNVYMVFKASDGTLHNWTIGVDALEAQIQYGWYKRNYELKYINLEDNKTGKIHKVVDFRPFVVENNFRDVITDLYHELGNDDQALVHEVWYIVTQLTTYSQEVEETPRFPLETMIGGGGDCEDMAILIASMLKAAPANYVVKLVCMDSDNPTDPKEPNHVTVWVETPSGYKTFVDGTSKTDMCPFREINGWYLKI